MENTKTTGDKILNIDEVKAKLGILYERRSIRKFKPDPVPKPVLMDLIKYATLAPTATNRQAWRFIIVTDSSLKQKIVDAGGSVLINKASCGILVTYENTTRNLRYRDEIQSASACIQNMLLAAHAYGLGACWVCTLPSVSYLRKLFGMPSNYSPVAYIILGYPLSETVKDVPRKNTLDDIVSENSFPGQKLVPRKSGLVLFAERLLIRVYDSIPVFLKKKYVNKIVDGKFTKKFDN